MENRAIQQSDCSSSLPDIRKSKEVWNGVPRSGFSIPPSLGPLSPPDSSPTLSTHGLSGIKRGRSPSEGPDVTPKRVRMTSDTESENTTEKPIVSATAPSRSLYISNLSRDICKDAFKFHIAKAGTAANLPPVNLADFYLDRHRTHSYVVFADSNSAELAAKNLDGTSWPSDSHQRLVAQLVPDDKIQAWITTEVSSTPRERVWTPVKSVTCDGKERWTLTSKILSGAAPCLNASGSDKASGQARSDNKSVIWTPLDTTVHTTKFGPPITFQTVSAESVKIRVTELRRHYSLSEARRFTESSGTGINRFSFAHSIHFIDRGNETHAGVHSDKTGRRSGRSRAKNGDYYNGEAAGRHGICRERPRRRGNRAGRKVQEIRAAQASKSAKESSEQSGGGKGENAGEASRRRKRRHRGPRGSKVDSYVPGYD